MEIVPQTPDQQTRNAVTARIAEGWPRLGEPAVTWRGRYCYVAAKPGRRQPAPFPRLRWQDSPDEWAIGIYKATTEQYSENGSPGPSARSPARPNRESTRPSPSTQARRPGNNPATPPIVKLRKSRLQWSLLLIPD